jgi:uncharacterized membrane protein
MKSFLSFIRSTLTGGILFLLPVVLLVLLFDKAHNLLLKVSTPFAEKLPERIFGFDGSYLLAVFLLIFICFMSGLLFRSSLVKVWIRKIEDNVLVNLPGYALIKSISAGAIGEQSEHEMSPILIHEDDSWSLAFLVEQGEIYSTVFIPDAPRHDAGEIKIIRSDRIQKLDISSNKFSQSIKTFGKGAIKWVK